MKSTFSVFILLHIIVGVLTGIIGAAPAVSVNLIEPFQLQIVNNGTITEEFRSLEALGMTGAELLGLRDFVATFEVAAVSGDASSFNYAFSLQSVPSTASLETTDFPTTGTISEQWQNISITLECAETAEVTLQFFLALTGPDGVEIITFPFVKQCKAPGCSENCDMHGTCEEIVGICHCDAGYHGEDCGIQFYVDVPSAANETSPAACLDQDVTILWNIPSDRSTRYDWWGIFPEEAINSLNWSNLIYWEYLNSGSKRWADYTKPVGNASLVASSPGNIVLAFFPNDGYEPWGWTTFTYKPWSVCRSSSSFDCSRSCQNGGICANSSASSSYCDCPAGFFWKDCSLGCAGVKTLSSANGTFSVGGSKRPLPLSSSGCSWLISPPPPVTRDRESPDANVLSIAGSQLLRPQEINASSVLIIMRIYSGGQGYAGFQARWTTNYIKVNQLQAIFYDHPASIVFMVILAIFLAIACVLLILLAKYRKSWIIRASTPSFLALQLYGACLGMAALPQFWGTPTVASCALRFWLPSLGWVVMFTCYLIKSWRILKIFNNKKVRPVSITDARLLLMAGIAVAYEVIFLIIWTAVDTPVIVRQADRLTPDSDYLVCSGKTTIFPILSLFSKTALVIWGISLALRTRKIVELFSESGYIAIAIYSVSFTSVIFVPLLYILPEFQVLWLVLASAGIVLVFIAPIAVTTFRFVRFFIKYPDGLTDSQVRQITMSHKMKQTSQSGSRIAAGMGGSSNSQPRSTTSAHEYSSQKS